MSEPASGADPAQLPHETVEFAHNSERQFAKLLDFYGIAWLYEPHTFVLSRNARGDPTQAFSPDFYLPAYDLYIEITTLKQKLVTRKNRKVRLLLDQHPELQVKILYQRDYLNLLVKYGLESPEQLAGYDEAVLAGEVGDSLLSLGLEPVNRSREPAPTLGQDERVHGEDVQDGADRNAGPDEAAAAG